MQSFADACWPTNMADSGGRIGDLKRCMINHQLAWRSKTDDVRTSRELPDPDPICLRCIRFLITWRDIYQDNCDKKKNSRHFIHFSSWKWNLSQSFRCSFFVVICIQCPNSQNYHPLEDVVGLTRHQQKGIRHLKNVVIQNQSQDLFAWNWIEGDTLSLSRDSIRMPVPFINTTRIISLTQK